MKTGWIHLGRKISFPFCGVDMDKNRLFDVLHVFSTFQCVAEGIQVMSVNGTHIGESQIFKEITRIERIFRFLLGIDDGLDRGISNDWHLMEDILDFALETVIGRIGPECCQISGHCSDIFGNGHVILVEYDNEPGVGMASIVQRLIDQPSGEGTVPNDSNRKTGILF